MHTAACSVAYIVVEEILSDLLRREVMDGILDKHIDTLRIISAQAIPLTKSGKPLCLQIPSLQKSLSLHTVGMARPSPRNASPQRWHIRKEQIVQSDVQLVMLKSVSPPGGRDSVPKASPFHKGDDVRADRCRPGLCSRFSTRYRRHRKTRDSLPRQVDKVNFIGRLLTTGPTPTQTTL